MTSNDGVVRGTNSERSDAFLQPIRRSSHAPFLHRARLTGTLHVVFFHGEAEGAPGNGIALASFDDARQCWSVPRMVVSDERFSMQNPVLFERADGALVLLHTRQDAGPLGESQSTSDVLQWTSTDDGRTWSADEVVVFPRGRGAFLRAPVVASATTAGRLMLPVYFTPEGEFEHANQVSGVVESLDGGHSWLVDAVSRMPGSEGAVGVQPAMVRLSPSRLVAFMRNRTSSRRIMRSVSEDDGRTWGPLTATPLPSNNSSVAACVLSDGRVVVAFNNCEPWARFPLSLAVSRDGGASFDRVVDIVDHEIIDSVTRRSRQSFAGEHSYPSLWHDDSSGVLHVAFTFLRTTIGYIRLAPGFVDRGDGNQTSGLWCPLS